MWDEMNLLELGGGISAKLAGPEGTIPSGHFDAAYTVCRNAYTGAAELEIIDWKAS